ncbi:[NiFe]-hydrogenase assembly chaperone HybE [Bradyrhizobium sp. USDA 10063]
MTSFEDFGAQENLADGARMECGIRWIVYDPAEGDEASQIAAETPFAALPENWRCPNCDAPNRSSWLLKMTPDREQHPRRRAHADASGWGEKLAAAYRDIADRIMRDLPIFNEALGVEAIGVRAREGRVVGTMVTPWFMNMITPVRNGTSQSSRDAGLNLHLRSLSSDIESAVSEVAPVGSIASCSLFSPMFQFEDMVASARTTAESVLAAVISPSSRVASLGPGAPQLSSIDRLHFLRGALTERRA